MYNTVPVLEIWTRTELNWTELVCVRRREALPLHVRRVRALVRALRRARAPPAAAHRRAQLRLRALRPLLRALRPPGQTPPAPPRRASGVRRRQQQQSRAAAAAAADRQPHAARRRAARRPRLTIAIRNRSRGAVFTWEQRTKQDRTRLYNPSHTFSCSRASAYWSRSRSRSHSHSHSRFCAHTVRFCTGRGSPYRTLLHYSICVIISSLLLLLLLLSPIRRGASNAAPNEYLRLLLSLTHTVISLQSRPSSSIIALAVQHCSSCLIMWIERWSRPHFPGVCVYTVQYSLRTRSHWTCIQYELQVRSSIQFVSCSAHRFSLFIITCCTYSPAILLQYNTYTQRALLSCRVMSEVSYWATVMYSSLVITSTSQWWGNCRITILPMPTLISVYSYNIRFSEEDVNFIYVSRLLRTCCTHFLRRREWE